MARVVFAERFDQACNGLSHRLVGEMLGLPGETVRRYRKGKTSVPLYVAAELCKKLGLSPVWLMTGEGEPHAGPDGRNGHSPG